MVVSHLQQEYGGHEYYLCRALSKIGHEVTLYTSDRTRPGYDSKKFFEMADHEEFKIKRLHSSIEVNQIPIMSGLSHELKKENLDIIHSHEFFQQCTFTACRIAQKRKVPFILTQHAMGHLPLNKLIWLPYIASKKIVGSYIFGRSDQIISLSSESQCALLSMGIAKEKISLIPTGVSTEIFAPSINSIISDFGIKSGERVILFVGRLVENKGVHILLHAFSLIHCKVDRVKLVIVGTGEMEPNLKSLAKDLGIEKEVLFLGKIDQKIIPAIFAGADIFVLPTLYTEPFGIVAVEALLVVCLLLLVTLRDLQT